MLPLMREAALGAALLAAFRAAALAATYMTMAFRDDGLHRGVHRAGDLFIVYGNCGFGFDCGVYDPGYGYGAAREMPLPAAAIIARGRL